MRIDGTIGVISDTHSLLRPEAVDALRGSELILHAGDIGKLDVLDQLRGIAPVVAVRGNIDKTDWTSAIPEVEAIKVNGKFIYLLHNVDELDIDPVGQFDAVVFGHSHVACNERRSGVLYFNPASAGPRRFSLPVAVGRLWFDAQGEIQAQIVDLGLN